MTIGERIKDLRKQYNVSQEQFAEDMQVSRQTVFRWENGITTPKNDQIEIISKYFGLNLQNFFSVGESSDCESLPPVVSESAISSDESDAESESAEKTKKRRTLRNIIISLSASALMVAVMIYFVFFWGRLPKELEGDTILYHASFYVVDWPGLIIFLSSAVLCILAIIFTVYYVKKYKKEKTKIKRRKKHETKKD